MLVVRTELRISPVHGLGVFAAEPIQKSQVIWRPHPSCDLYYSAEAFARLPEAFREAIEYYGYFHRETQSFMYEVDNGRFINHSENPTMKRGRRVMTAARDLGPGDEITADYREFCDDCSENIDRVFSQSRSFIDFASLRHGPQS